MIRVVQPFIMLFLSIALGAILSKLKLIDLDFSKKLSKLVVRVTFPVMLFLAMSQNINSNSLRQGLIFWILGLGTSIFLAVTAAFSGHRLGLKGKTFGTYQILCTNGNNIFLPVPIILSLFGAEYIVYAFLFELGAGLFYWSYGISHFRSGPRFSLKRVLNLNLLALIFGLLAGLSGIKFPHFITGFLEIVGNITIGSALLIIGSLSFNLFQEKTPWRQEVLGVVGHRLVLSPLVAVLALALFPLPTEMGTILLLLLSMPPLATTALVASTYAADQDLATMGVVVTTLLSLLVVPLFLFLRF